MNFASKIEVKNKEKFVEVVTLSLTRCSAFPVTIAGINCNALIRTGATRSCISETFYNQFMLPQLLIAFCLMVTSASDSTLCPMGIAQCLLKLGGHSFEFNFIVCQNLAGLIMLGLDFLHKCHIRLSWSDIRKRTSYSRK